MLMDSREELASRGKKTSLYLDSLVPNSWRPSIQSCTACRNVVLFLISGATGHGLGKVEVINMCSMVFNPTTNLCRTLGIYPLFARSTWRILALSMVLIQAITLSCLSSVYPAMQSEAIVVANRYRNTACA